jgi:exopolysaccharide biosynthesis polyprenyl glycosylphosphotransferase
MLLARTQGLWQLHGLVFALALPLVFSFYAYISYAWWGVLHYAMFNHNLYGAGVLVAGFLAFPYSERLQTGVGRQQLWQVMGVSNRQTLCVTVVILLLMAGTQDKGISRLFVGSFITTAWGFSMLFNTLVPRLLAKVIFNGQALRGCLLVGKPAQSQALAGWILSRPELGLDVCGYLDTQGHDASCNSTEPSTLHRQATYTDVPGTKPVASLRCLGTTGHLEQVLLGGAIHQVILIETHPSKAWMDEVLRTCDKYGCRILIYAPWQTYIRQPLLSIQEDTHTFFIFKDEPLENPFNYFWKRFFDIALALPICCLVLPPLCALTWLIHRLQAPGPLFFKQERIGLNRRPFTIYKFRSMFHTPDGHNESLQAGVKDKRIFGFGQWMRRVSLDEFPQFFNVLCGHMSIVGPRPHYIGHDRLFTQYIHHYRKRHFAKPGITGLAQIKGYRGEITDLQLLAERTQHDLSYIDNWSVTLDVIIVLKTIWAVIRPPKSAY